MFLHFCFSYYFVALPKELRCCRKETDLVSVYELGAANKIPTKLQITDDGGKVLTTNPINVTQGQFEKETSQCDSV